MLRFEIGETVICTGDSGFCHSSKTKIIEITIKYDENTGKPYPVYKTKQGDIFDGRTGYAIKPPLAYYIKKINN